METLQISLEPTLKTAAESILHDMGLDLETSLRMFLTNIIKTRKIPFEVAAHTNRVELFDGYGSYICEYGHIHDYSKLDLGDQELSEPFDNLGDLFNSLHED